MSTPLSLQVPECASAVLLEVPGAWLAALDARPVEQTAGTVVLVPGYTGSKEDFLLLLEPFTAAGRRVISFDMRGQYESAGEHPPESYRLESLAADLLGVIEAVGEGPLHVVGHSFGGLVSRMAALAEPRSFRSLTLLDSGPAALPGPRAERIRTLRPLLLDGGKPAVWDAMVAAGGGDPVPAEVAAFLHSRFHANDQAGLLVMGDALLDEPDRTQSLGATGIPILVAYGEDDDAWPPQVQHAMAERLRARHTVIAGAVHSPAVEQPDSTARALLEFWAEVDGVREAIPATA